MSLTGSIYKRPDGTFVILSTYGSPKSYVHVGSVYDTAADETELRFHVAPFPSDPPVPREAPPPREPLAPPALPVVHTPPKPAVPALAPSPVTTVGSSDLLHRICATWSEPTFARLFLNLIDYTEKLSSVTPGNDEYITVCSSDILFSAAETINRLMRGTRFNRFAPPLIIRRTHVTDINRIFATHASKLRAHFRRMLPTTTPPAIVEKPKKAKKHVRFNPIPADSLVVFRIQRKLETFYGAPDTIADLLLLLPVLDAMDERLHPTFEARGMIAVPPDIPTPEQKAALVRVATIHVPHPNYPFVRHFAATNGYPESFEVPVPLVCHRVEMRSMLERAMRSPRPVRRVVQESNESESNEEAEAVLAEHAQPVESTQ